VGDAIARNERKDRGCTRQGTAARPTPQGAFLFTTKARGEGEPRKGEEYLLHFNKDFFIKEAWELLPRENTKEELHRADPVWTA